MFCPVGGAIFIRMIYFFWKTAYNMPYHKEMGYNMANIAYASPIPTPIDNRTPMIRMGPRNSGGGGRGECVLMCLLIAMVTS